MSSVFSQLVVPWLYVKPLHLSFLIYKMELIAVPTSQAHWEDSIY